MCYPLLKASDPWNTMFWWPTAGHRLLLSFAWHSHHQERVDWLYIVVYMSEWVNIVWEANAIWQTFVAIFRVWAESIISTNMLAIYGSGLRTYIDHEYQIVRNEKQILMLVEWHFITFTFEEYILYFVVTVIMLTDCRETFVHLLCYLFNLDYAYWKHCVRYFK